MASPEATADALFEAANVSLGSLFSCADAVPCESLVGIARDEDVSTTGELDGDAGPVVSFIPVPTLLVADDGVNCT